MDTQGEALTALVTAISKGSFASATAFATRSVSAAIILIRGGKEPQMRAFLAEDPSGTLIVRQGR